MGNVCCVDKREPVLERSISPMLQREEVETLSDASEETEETKETQNTRNTCCDCENTDGEDESLSKKEHGTLKSGRLALRRLKESGFDERDVTKHSFKAL